jgi:hypothetical protein
MTREEILRRAEAIASDPKSSARHRQEARDIIASLRTDMLAAVGELAVDGDSMVRERANRLLIDNGLDPIDAGQAQALRKMGPIDPSRSFQDMAARQRAVFGGRR